MDLQMSLYAVVLCYEVKGRLAINLQIGKAAAASFSNPFSKPASNEQSRAIHQNNDIHLPAQPSTNTSNITAPCPNTNRNSYRKRNTSNLIDRVMNDKQSGGTKQ
jgi:hypothetical protein